MVSDLKRKNIDIEEGFDAVICLGNSFAHLPADEDGKQEYHRQALRNFKKLLKPNSGVLIIDHRNYDAILNRGTVPQQNVYYNVSSHTHIYTHIDIT